ncbi:hypothetical protein J6590_106152 [Homalodisca vitripennis]|nr:hypothetical protein J6590_106152 [Homalodisca vitripennis]
MLLQEAITTHQLFSRFIPGSQDGMSGSDSQGSQEGDRFPWIDWHWALGVEHVVKVSHAAHYPERSPITSCQLANGRRTSNLWSGSDNGNRRWDTIIRSICQVGATGYRSYRFTTRSTWPLAHCLVSWLTNYSGVKQEAIMAAGERLTFQTGLFERCVDASDSGATAATTSSVCERNK